jgi:hypothetical protein
MSTSQGKPGLKVLLSLYLKEKYPNWINGGELEMFAVTQSYKASNGSRRCRELADEGTLERRINGKSVEYRYLQKEPQKSPTNFRCFRCPKDAVTYLEGKPVCLDHSKKKVAQVGMF